MRGLCATRISPSIALTEQAVHVDSDLVRVTLYRYPHVFGHIGEIGTNVEKQLPSSCFLGKRRGTFWRRYLKLVVVPG